MIKFDRENNNPHTVPLSFWIELSKIDTTGVDDPVLAFMLSPDGTSPRVVTRVEYIPTNPRFGQTYPTVRIHGIDYKWGWDADDTVPWWDMNDTPRFAELKVCGPEYLEYHKYAGSTYGVSMPQFIKDRIVFNRDVKEYARGLITGLVEGVCSTLWEMYGNVESEASAYEIMRGSEHAKYILLEDNRWLKSKCKEIDDLVTYNALPSHHNREEWGFSWNLMDLLFFSVPRSLENDGSVSCYPDDGDGLDLHNATLEEWNKVQQALALNSIDKAMTKVRNWCITRFKYDPHLQQEATESVSLTTGD